MNHFNKLRKELLDNPLKEFGFRLYESNSLARVTNDHIFQCIIFNHHRHGGKFTVDIVIRPLFCPHNGHLILLPGNRLFLLATQGKNDKWWPHSTEAETQESLQEVYKLTTEFAMPFFESTKSSKDIIKSYQKNIFGKNKFGKSISWGTVGWEDFDFGHIYLRAGDAKNASKHFNACYNEFKKDTRDWAQQAARKCVEMMEMCKASKNEVDLYFGKTLEESRRNLKLTDW